MHAPVRRISCSTLSLLSFVWIAAAPAEDDLWLARDGQARSTIVRGEEDGFAADRLRRWLADASGARVNVLVAGKDRLPEEGCIVAIGSVASNPLVKKLCDSLSIRASTAELTDQGYVARRARHEGRDWLLLAGGGGDGTLHAVADLMNWRLRAADKGVSIGPCDARKVPRMKYRWFWNWDHRMDWGGPGRVGNVMGGGGTFSKRPEAFLIDCKNCVDYMADHKFNGLILWGFLRDTHGGVEATRELCRYAAERGVRILPGVGTSGYAGYYFEGDHPMNADAWLAKHPELRSVEQNGKPRNAPCPSNKANQDWLDEGAKWLFENFQVGGVNLEMGDFFVCYCDACKKARAAIDSKEPDYYKDMAISHAVTLETMRKLSPGAWLSYATYTGYTADMMKDPPKFISMIPEDAICQWTLTGMAGRWPADVRPMTRHNVGYLHWCNSSTHTEDDFYLDQIRDICRNAAGAGFEGLDTYGELSPQRPNVEIAYLAWEAFLWNPEMTIEEFVDERLGRLYGGPKAARTLLEITPLVRTRKLRETGENLAKARKLAEDARAAASPDGHEHWDRLIAYLAHHEKEAQANREEQRRVEATVRTGRRIAVASVKASDEAPQDGWGAAKAVDGNVKEPEGYWLTRKNSPEQAWLELTLAQPAKINRVAIFHQLDPAHYRSLDYSVSVRADGKWKPVATVKNNERPGWIAHAFEPVATDAVRLDITRSAYGNRMGIGEIELRFVE
jgi:hypothetical protein